MSELLQAPAIPAATEPGFAARHIGPSAAEQAEMLAIVDTTFVSRRNSHVGLPASGRVP